MDYYILISNLLLYICKISCLLGFIQYYGLYNGIIITVSGNFIWNAVICKLYNLERFSVCDLNFVGWEPERQYNMNMTMVINGRDREKLKILIQERCIKQIKRLRQKVVYLWGDAYWQNADVREALNRVEIIDDKFKTESDILQFSEELSKKPFFPNEFPYRYYIANYEENKMLLIFQFDHCVSDGYGLLYLMSKLSDNNDLSAFYSLKKKSIWTTLFNILVMPFFAFFTVFILMVITYQRSPFKCYQTMTLQKRAAMTKRFDFKSIYALTKKYNITFNDYVLSIIATASKKYANSLGYNNMSCITCFIPINLRDRPRSADEIDLFNNSSGVPFKVNFNDDPIKQFRRVNRSATFYVRNRIFVESVHYLNTLCNNIAPYIFSRVVNILSSKRFDYVITNVPGPKTPFIVNGWEISDLLLAPSSALHSAFIIISTYLDKARIFLVQEDKIHCDHNEFIKYVEAEVEESLKLTKSN